MLLFMSRKAPPPRAVALPSASEIRAAAGILGRKGGRIGGLSRSPAKIASARENGKLGGRPRTKTRSL
ncbi:MAG: hypothetical protein DMF95_23215 [Acidobacteria bacterium]|nr:MAG: hypothetical protein DMF95_23215 [Acidobacteriota bacterium]